MTTLVYTHEFEESITNTTESDYGFYTTATVYYPFKSPYITIQLDINEMIERNLIKKLNEKFNQSF